MVAESLIVQAPDPIFVSDLHAKILQPNDAACEFLGFEMDELIQQRVSR
jgi:PAS domain S-box-containing protein